MSFVHESWDHSNGSARQNPARPMWTSGGGSIIHPDPRHDQRIAYKYVGMGANAPQRAMEHVQPHTGSCLERVGKNWASALGISVLTLIGAMYNLVFLRRILPAMGKSSSIPVDFALFNAFWVLTGWSYIASSCGDPGYVSNRRSPGSLPSCSGLAAWTRDNL